MYIDLPYQRDDYFGGIKVSMRMIGKGSFRITYLTLIVLMFLVGFASANLFTKTKGTEEKTIQVERQEKKLDSLINLNTSRGELSVLVTQDQVIFEPLEKAESKFKQFSLAKEKYPRLFEQGVANASWITARILEKSDRVLVVVSNNQPSHGGGESVYELYVDPVTGKIEVRQS